MDFSRLSYRIDVWDTLFLEHIQSLKKEKEVLICGHMNVLERDIDLANHEYYFKDVNFKDKISKERFSFFRFLEEGLVDIYRKFYSEKIIFSWVGPKALQLPSTCLDYFLLTQEIEKKVLDVNIKTEQPESDHFPIVLETENKQSDCVGDGEVIYYLVDENKKEQYSLFS